MESSTPRFYIRPIRESDLDGLTGLVATIKDNLTSLPYDHNYLEERLQLSLRSFVPGIRRPGGEYYLFVMVEAETEQVVGCCGVVAKVGGYDPFYTYEVREERVVHPPMGIEKTVDVLHLKMDHRGPSEIGSLYLHPDFRLHGLGRLLSMGRFLFIAEFSERFEQEIVAEMRGYIDESGSSPFWDALCVPFFGTDFRTADVLSGLGDKEFILNLMPKYPIYVDLLAPAAQSVIGKVHTNTEPALKMLLSEGFERSECIDIFDGGPMLRARTDHIRVVRDRDIQTVFKIVDALPETEHAPLLLANHRLDFRCCLGHVIEAEAGGIMIDQATARLLHVTEGETIQFAAQRT